VVHYVPEQACTVRVRRLGERTLYGKCRADDRGAVAARVHARVARDAKAIRLAPVIAHLPDKRILWQEEVAGRPLEPTDVRARPRHWAARIAGAITAFHNLPRPAHLKRLSVSSMSKTLAARMERSRVAMPLLASRIESALKLVDSKRPDEPLQVLSHCSLYPANLLWDGHSFAIINLDACALAPRALDYGTLTAALIHNAVEDGARDSIIDGMVATLRAAALDELGSEHEFDWFVAASLLGDRLYRCATHLQSPQMSMRERLLAQAERLAMRHG
jgi:Phosphotransferase enzyme family